MVCGSPLAGREGGGGEGWIMRLSAWPRLLALGTILLVVAGAAAVALLYLADRNLPVYEDGEQPPIDGIAVNTLSRGDALYVSGPFEFSLEEIVEPPDVTWGRQVGKTDRGLAIYRPKGHDGSQYVFARGEMTGDIVYRRSGSAAPVRLEDLDVTALEFVHDESGSPTVKRTSDRAIIQELVATLTGGAGVRPDPATPRRIYHVRLLSDQLPGLAYFAYVIIDDRDAVYLAQRAQEDERWIPVDDQLSAFLRVTP
jgi:hypothetical protein